MIFATVGTQLAFPRFLTVLDGIAGRHGLRIVAQTCDPDARYRHLESHPHLDPAAFDGYMRSARLIVGHAGIGTILSARRAEKPLVAFPRLASLGEHRNEHQLATVATLGERPGIYVAHDDAELERLLITPGLSPLRMADSPARAGLLDTLRTFIAA